jgi:hypothetical protein
MLLIDTPAGSSARRKTVEFLANHTSEVCGAKLSKSQAQDQVAHLWYAFRPSQGIASRRAVKLGGQPILNNYSDVSVQWPCGSSGRPVERHALWAWLLNDLLGGLGPLVELGFGVVAAMLSTMAAIASQPSCGSTGDP